MRGIKSTQAIKEVLKARGWSQERLAYECGMKSQSNITGVLNRGVSMRVSTLVLFADALGCEVVIRDKMGTKAEWVINDSGKE